MGNGLEPKISARVELFIKSTVAKEMSRHMKSINSNLAALSKDVAKLVEANAFRLGQQEGAGVALKQASEMGWKKLAALLTLASMLGSAAAWGLEHFLH